MKIKNPKNLDLRSILAVMMDDGVYNVRITIDNESTGHTVISELSLKQVKNKDGKIVFDTPKLPLKAEFEEKTDAV